ncbi:MAG: hypothetical protein ACFFCM_21340, partial [Promethearchaeota archaeon]
MVFSDLKILFEKQNRLFLVLVTLLIIGFTLSQFGLFGLGTFIFVFLLGICMVLITATLIFRMNLRELSQKQIILYLLIAIGITFLIIMRFYIGHMFFQVYFIFGIIAYVAITSIFSMYYCYQLGVSWDGKIQNKEINWLRWVIFLGCTLFSIIYMLSISRLGIFLQNRDVEVDFAFGVVALILRYYAT